MQQNNFPIFTHTHTLEAVNYRYPTKFAGEKEKRRCNTENADGQT